MKWNNVLAPILLVALLASCKTPQKTTERVYTYKESLAAYRPTVEGDAVVASGGGAVADVTPTHQINDEVNDLMEKASEKNREIRYAQGYRVQVYTGTSREEANKAKERVYYDFPNVDVYLSYNQPTFKLKVGDYTDRLDAQKALVRLKEHFPTATIVDERVNLPQSNR
ncbi:Sporulation related domain-containing protein [Catalinimonas alkaloidigena]|uniref:Sporulation related domain-containing protein n=1 Tax=Catalinimonas alkaloidigena TaxID=1075417 RepID=A0A1G9DFG3_9BACT|nr:SPOR domain-containing protein [Catalinimonas alkaloidigena]SDK62583.1 Sporulation related domain-containing protein [Catalinimonas alkaloidigena]